MAERVRRYNEVFEEFVRELCASGRAEEAYLIGSRARGDWTDSSDFDVVIVINDNKDPLDVATRARLLKKESVPLDIIVLRRSESRDPIYAEMLKHIKKIC